MSEEKVLGKIESVFFGLVGYHDPALGIHFTFSFEGSGISASRATHDPETIKWTESYKWTEEDRDKEIIEIFRYISKLLKQAKVRTVEKLRNIPVEVTLEGNTLKDWRILTEVL